MKWGGPTNWDGWSRIFLFNNYLAKINLIFLVKLKNQKSISGVDPEKKKNHKKREMMKRVWGNRTVFKNFVFPIMSIKETWSANNQFSIFVIIISNHFSCCFTLVPTHHKRINVLFGWQPLIARNLSTRCSKLDLEHKFERYYYN